jgi:hypothetical protein
VNAADCRVGIVRGDLFAMLPWAVARRAKSTLRRGIRP